MSAAVRTLLETVLAALVAIGVGVADAVLWHRFGVAFDTALIVAGLGALGIHAAVTAIAAQQEGS